MNAADVLLGPARARGLLDRPALILGDSVVTYRQLDEGSARAGNALRALGVRRRDRVLLMVKDRPDFFHVYLGAMKIGAVPVGLNLRASARDLGFMVEDSGCRVLVIDGEFLETWSKAAAAIDDPPAVVVAQGDTGGRPGLAALMAPAAPTLASEPMAEDDMALWMYTSGTTGRPKAAVHVQRGVLESGRYLAECLRLGPGDRVFCTSKLFFAFALGHCLLGALRIGATVVLNEGWPSLDAVAEAVERHRPTAFLSVPALYRTMLDSGLAASPAFRAVRHYVAAGERLPEPLFERWREASGRPILEGIGTTESMFLICANRPEAFRAGTCGEPTPGVEVRLEGAGTEPGVMWMRSPSVAAGYWRQPERTAEAFRDGWLRTGDMFTRDAGGRYVYQGRGDDMLKVSGQWVSPAEIEEVVLRHPAVAEAAVVGVPDAAGLMRLALFLVARERGCDRALIEAELKANLAVELSIYKCPRRVFHLDELPRTATGKVQRFVLRGMAAEPQAIS